MFIRLSFASELQIVKDALRLAFVNSRFKCEIEQRNPKTLKLVKVRLKENKPYCGNHPAFCEVQSGRKPRNLNFLEGLDWVAVNDMLNDTLDDLGISANVVSSVCIIRRFKSRRIAYYEDPKKHQAWDKEGEDCFADYTKSVHVRSNYPNGTPGNPSYI